jgi:hypothetical protein
VFSKNEKVVKAAIKFFVSQLVIMIVAAESTHYISEWVDFGEVITPIVIRVPVDFALFAASYVLQKLWILKEKK